MSLPCLLLFLLTHTTPTSGDLNLTILHNNDLHSRFDPVSGGTSTCRPPAACYGGIGRLVRAVTDFKAREPNSLMLYGGDIFQGHIYYTLFKWWIVAEMMNMVPYDAMALGNHEFDDKLAGLLPYMKNISHPLLCTNIDFGTKASAVTDRCRSSIVREMGGYKIGIMGFTTTDTPEITPVSSAVKFADEVEALQAETRRLQQAGAQIIIAVGHSGYSREKEMAEQIDGVDVIVGGHSHSLLYNGPAPDDNPVAGPYPTVVYQPSGRTVLVVQAYQFGKYLGMLNVTFDDDGEVRSWAGNPILLDGEKDEEAERRLQGYKDRVKELETQVIGRTLVHLEGHRSVCRFKECNLGNLMADGALRRCLMSGGPGWSQVTAAIINSGMIRKSIPPGNITQADVQYAAYTLNVLTLSGRTLRSMFEHSVSQHGNAHGRFLQVAGLRVTYDLDRAVGSRVTALDILCSNCSVPVLKPVLESQRYSVVMPRFIVNGGDGYSMLKGSENQVQVEFEALEATVLRAQVVRLSPVITGLEGRLMFEPRRRLRRAPQSSSGLSPTVSVLLLLMLLMPLLATVGSSTGW